MIYNPFRRLGLKAMSVALAVLIWLSVSGEQIVERSLRVPLQLQNVPEKLDLVDVPPPTVDVRVRGGSGLLSHLASGDVVAVLDLASARPGRRFIPLSVERVEAPVGVEVTQVMPSTISLEFQRTGSRMVRVMPMLDGQPAPGYAVESATAQPAVVEVVGPENELRQLGRVNTEPISIAGLSETVRESVMLGVSVPGLRLKTPGKAVVTVDIRPVPVMRSIAGVAVRPRNLAPTLNAVVTPSQASVSATGVDAAFAGITGARFGAFVNLAGLGPGRYNLPVQVEPPPNLRVVQVQPPNVAVRIK
jgi:YbbR domain-containing protein